ncbi:MAG: GyrI-like domain-containing protein [Anaerolineales bacterium]
MAMPIFLMRLFTENLDGYRPRIVDLECPIQIVGMTMDTSMKGIYRDIPAIGKKFLEYKKVHAVPARKEPWSFAAVSRGFDKATGAFSYTIGDVVTSLENIPAGLTSFEIPAIRYPFSPCGRKTGWSGDWPSQT